MVEYCMCWTRNCGMINDFNFYFNFCSKFYYVNSAAIQFFFFFFARVKFFNAVSWPFFAAVYY